MTLQSYDWLLTAHHADDQMETMLMKMVREDACKTLRESSASNLLVTVI
ncbi:hypothetical protein OM428_04305 [Enterococcus gallinarum]|nr:hypothetical protein [Enterococcus gallinarum]